MKIFSQIVAITILLFPASAFALNLDGNSGQIDFSVKPVGPAVSPVPVFGTGVKEELICPGSGFPCFGVPVGPVQTTGLQPISPPLSDTADPSIIDFGNFGSGNMTLQATGFPGGGGGILWGPQGEVIDFGLSNNTASVNESFGTAIFQNLDGSGPLFQGGAFLAVAGFLDKEGQGIVTGSLKGKLSAGGRTEDVGIVVIYNGLAPNFGTIYCPFRACAASNFIPTSPTTFFAYAIDLVPGQFLIAPGDTGSVQGTLSFDADPGAGIKLAQLPSNLTVPLPDFFIGAGATQSVPEPTSTISFLVFSTLATASTRLGQLKFFKSSEKKQH